ncbi:MAG: GTP-binding protein [Candidatus Heimdallarchaeota archaeon]|nr:GTP-binding protein [Candidatus Heimdallarchaeota archaeon]
MSNRIMLRMHLIGDGAVGKTSLRNRYMGKGFTTSHNMTIGADFAAKDMHVIVNGKQYDITAQIWDMAGQQRFTEIRSRFYGGSQGGLCVFDLTRADSFQNINNWITELWKHNGKGVVPLMLLGNKSDLKQQREVPEKRILDYCNALSAKTKDYGFEVKYLETSAANGENIDLAFQLIGEIIISDLLSKGRL